MVNSVFHITNLTSTKFVIAPTINRAFVLDLRHFSLDVTGLLELVFTVEREAELNLKIIGVGLLLVNLNLKIELVGIGAQAIVTGAFLATGDSCVRFNVMQNHLISQAQSAVQIKTVLLDCTQFDYQGTIFIAAEANGSIASQENRNISLSPMVKVRSVPNLEVLNSDVQCSHGSAVGELDRTQMIYLMSRGLSQAAAIVLLLQSFLGDDSLDLGLIKQKF